MCVQAHGNPRGLFVDSDGVIWYTNGKAMYRNIVYNPKRGTMWYSDWDSNGLRIDHEVPYHPYLYLKDSTGIDAISIYEEPLKKYEFDTSWERKEFCQSTKRTYFNLPPEQQFLIDHYWMFPQDENFSKFPLKVWFFDIEVFCADGFPNPIEARWPINVMTIFDYTEKRYHVFTTAEQYYPKEKNVVVHLYPNDEFGMIKGFVKFWRSDYPDIISGWYSWGYDIPYLCNRMKILYNNEDAPSKLSPVGRTYNRENAKIRLGSEEKTYEQLWTICGVSSIDLQAAYLKFARVKLASYSLNYVCDHEKVGQKLEHDGSLSDWWLTDPQEFIDYNVQDVALLVKLEDKLRFMELCRAVAYSGLCPLEQSLKTLSTIGGLAAIEAMHQNRIISSFDTSDAKVNYEGGFVSEPIPGFHNNILSIDANSMYPNALISFNMSNETKVGNVLPNGRGGFILTSVSGKTKDITKDEVYRIMKEKQVACTPNGILFSQRKEGIMPAVVSRIYNTRKAAKKEMLSIEKELVNMPDSPEKEEKRKKAECLILNGTECEPYLTSDYRIMLERPKEILIGAVLMQKALGGCRCVVGIEENKPVAISAMRAAIMELGLKNIEVAVLKKKYPQGGEKQLIDAVMHRQVRSGALPIDAGAVVQNVGTSLAVYEAVQKNKPLITNVLTITGKMLPAEKQHNYLYRIGIPLSFIIEQAGGVPEGAAKLVSGGPMMGRAIANPDATTVKGSSSVLYLDAEDTLRKEASACIRCGRCADACPMGLEPFLLNRLCKAGDLEALEANAMQDCIECGCCIYSCPANIPLLDRFRIAKGQVIGAIRARAAAQKQ